MQKRTRAVAIILDNDRVLLMHRWRPEKEYFVFPGGGVEFGETVEDAVVREVREETMLEVSIEKLLYHHVYDDETEQYFYLCRYLSGEPKLGNGPEFKEPNLSNRFRPEWVDAKNLPRLLLYPLEIRDWLIKDIESGFNAGPRTVEMKVADLRQSI